jgi:16S rRNA (cytidine1402-2'-O)-methyltransferase
VPQKKGDRQRLLGEVAGLRATLILFESPHRIVETLRELATALPGRRVAVGRELTKLHEEVLRGTADGIAAILASRDAVKGEITLLVGPPAENAMQASDDEIAAAIDAALKVHGAARAAAEVARAHGLSRKAVYDRILARRRHD